jgi:hypothetical protein
MSKKKRDVNPNDTENMQIGTKRRLRDTFRKEQ